MATSTARPRNDGVDEAWIDEMLAESFPASDPPSWTLGREPSGTAPKPTEGPAPHTIESKTETSGSFRQVVSIDAHTLHADVSVASGGGGSAPGPHEYFDASLATCKALTACVVAKQRGFALERVRVEVVRDDSRERKGNYVLTVRLAFDGNLSQDEKLKLHDLVSRCPIHKLMTTTTVEIHQLPLLTATAGDARDRP